MRTNVTDDDLLRAFDRLCEKYGVVSRGFKPEEITAPIDGSKHDGTKQWAMKHRKNFGWMIVSGWKGCGCVVTRANGYVKNRWDFLMLIEALYYAKVFVK